ncbi:MAG TPA: fibronectin type III domain-containing protein, partial [bacterium]|nr:fibronectin type III domain-containing protein [bacterium]
MKLLRTTMILATVLLAACACAQDAGPDTTAATPLDTVPPTPVTALEASDYVDNSDAGDKIELTWALSPDDPADGGGSNDVLWYQIWRSEGLEAGWDSLGVAMAGQGRFLDEAAEPGVDYYYGLAAFDGTSYSEQVSFGPVSGQANFFQGTRASVLVLMLIFFAMVLVFTKLAERG